MKFSAKKNKEFTHGNEEDPFAIQHGQKTYEGTMTLFQSDFQALINAAEEEGVDVLDLSMDIVVMYKPKSPRNVPTVTKTLKFAEFTEFEEGMGDGDTHMKVALPFMFLGIQNAA